MPSGVAGSVGQLIGGAAGDVVSEKLLTSVNLGFWHLAKPLGSADWIAYAFSSIEDADANRVIGISPVGIVDIINKMIDTAMVFSVITDRELSQELFGEMIQEGISNAVQTSLGGALQTIWNVRRGALPGMTDYASDVGQNYDAVDDKIGAFVAAGAGLNPPVTAFDLVKGANREIENRYRSAVGQAELVLNYINNEFFSVISAGLANLHNLATRARTAKVQAAILWGDVARRIAEEHLARLNEIEDTLEGIKKYFDIDALEDQTALEHALLIEAELDATEEVFDRFINTLNSKLDETYSEIDSTLPEIRTALYNAYETIFKTYYRAYKMILEGVGDDTIAQLAKEKVEEIFKGVVAYREINTIDVEFSI